MSAATTGMICSEASDEEKVEAPRSPPPQPVDSFSVSILNNPDPTVIINNSTAVAANNSNGKQHPVIKTIQEKELGKILLAAAIAIVGIVVAGKDKLVQSEISFILILVSVGFTAILYGILLKERSPKFAQIVEPLGIALVAISFNAIVAFFLPVEILWVPALCIGLLCLLPVIALWPPAPAPT